MPVPAYSTTSIVTLCKLCQRVPSKKKRRTRPGLLRRGLPSGALPGGAEGSAWCELSKPAAAPPPPQGEAAWLGARPPGRHRRAAAAGEMQRARLASPDFSALHRAAPCSLARRAGPGQFPGQSHAPDSEVTLAEAREARALALARAGDAAGRGGAAVPTGKGRSHGRLLC